MWAVAAESEGPVLHIAKGANYMIDISMAMPLGWATAVLPLSTAQEVWEYLGQCIAEQRAAMEADLQKVVDGG